MSRVRPTWPELPAEVRAAIEERAGGAVVGWTSHDGGYSPGWALALATETDELFVKVASTQHEMAAKFHRQEGLRAAALPKTVPAPRYRWCLELSGWVVVASDVVHGRVLRTEPWDLADLDLLGRLAHDIAAHSVPNDGPFFAFGARPWIDLMLLSIELPAGLDGFDPWFANNLEMLAELANPGRQAEAFAGYHLIHGYLRADNALITVGSKGTRKIGERAVAIDWPHAKRGPAFIDLIGMLPGIAARGGPWPEQVLDLVGLPVDTDDEAVTIWITALTGYFIRASMEEPPPGIPHLRAFQRAQGDAALAWLRRRLEVRR